MAQQLLDRTGQRFGRLVALELAGRDNHRRATWLCRCDCGTEKVIPSRHLGSGAIVSCGCYRAETSAAAGKKGADKLRGDRSYRFKDFVGYYALHARIRAGRGPAKNYQCVDCGKAARHWSYDLTDPKPEVENGWTYSLDINRYEPRCVKCHSAHDWNGKPQK